MWVMFLIYYAVCMMYDVMARGDLVRSEYHRNYWSGLKSFPGISTCKRFPSVFRVMQSMISQAMSFLSMTYLGCVHQK